MKPLALLSAFVMWFAVCRFIPDRNTATGCVFLGAVRAHTRGFQMFTIRWRR